jgi:hypothetical protein
MNSRLRTSFVSASFLLAAAVHAQPQLKPIPGAPTLKPDLSHLQASIIDYNVWATGSARTSKSTSRIKQAFIAHTSKLTQVEANVAGAHNLKVSILRENGTSLGSATATASGDTATAKFDQAIALTPGEMYTVDFQNVGNATFYLADNDESYVFSQAVASGNLGADLNMKVTGMRPIVQTRPAPTKHALLILLENGGVKLDGIKELKDAQPKIEYWTCGSCKFESKKNENIQDLLGRVAQSLGNCMECVDPGKWHKESIPLDSWLKGFTDYALEETAKAVDLAVMGTSTCKYDKVVKCEDSAFTAENVLAKIDQLSKDYIIDIHVLSHGGPDSIVGYNNARLTPANFFTKIEERRAGGEPIQIRAVYQMNCFSGSLVAEWLAVGTDVVNGTKPDKLNMMPTQYFSFLQHWMNNEQFDTSVQKGFDDVKWYFDILYANAPQNVTSSQMFVHGDKNLRFK